VPAATSRRRDAVVSDRCPGSRRESPSLSARAIAERSGSAESGTHPRRRPGCRRRSLERVAMRCVRIAAYMDDRRHRRRPTPPSLDRDRPLRPVHRAMTTPERPGRTVGSKTCAYDDSIPRAWRATNDECSIRMTPPVGGTTMYTLRKSRSATRCRDDDRAWWNLGRSRRAHIVQSRSRTRPACRDHCRAILRCVGARMAPILPAAVARRVIVLMRGSSKPSGLPRRLVAC